MKTNVRNLTKILFSIIVLVSMLLQQPPVQASAPFREIQRVSEQDDQPPPEQALITLAVEMPDVHEFTKPLSPGEAKELAEQITFKQYLRLLPQLEQWKQDGVIGSYEFKPDLQSVSVEVLNVEQFTQLSKTEGIASILPLGEDPSVCAVASGREFTKQLGRISQASAFLNPEASLFSSDIQATDPSIEISWYEEDGWGYISGKTSPNTSVNLQVIRGGAPIVTKTKTSDSNGYYYFFPSYLGCPTNTYDFALMQSDIVEVSAGGRTVRTEVVALSAWLDPVTNQLSGVTAPGRQVKVEIIQSNLQNPCEWTDLAPLTGTAAGDGRFTISTPDINRTADAQILAMDSNGNGIYKWVSAFSIHVYPRWNETDFSIKPNTSFTTIHKRGSSVLETATGTSYSNGWGYVHFSNSFRAGDVIEVSSDGANMQYTIAGLSNVNINPDTNRISGVTAPAARVSIHFSKSSLDYYTSVIPTSCRYSGSCSAQISDGTGNFNIAAFLDLVRGDSVYIYLYDDQGNYQATSQLYVPAISLNPGTNNLDILWSETVNSLTVRHLNSGGTQKSSHVFYSNYYDPVYYGSLSEVVEAGDRIEVSDGLRTETLTVPASLPTARLSSATGRLSGTSPTGSDYWIARVYDFQSPLYSINGCLERSGGGSFDIPLWGIQVGGGDETVIYFRLSDGHYLSLYRRAFRVFHWYANYGVGVSAETPGTSITARLRRGSSDIATITDNSNRWGYRYLDFGVPTQNGDQIVVNTGDGNSYILNVRELSANLDPSGNRIYGKGPANQLVWVYLRRYISYSGAFSLIQATSVGSDGNYSVNYNNQYLSYRGTCELASVGHRCASASLYYYDSGGHGLGYWGPTPPPPPADSYENDNSIGTAKPYLGVQTHTFDVESDEDWVSFTVPQNDVDNRIRYRIQTFNRGYSTYTTIELFRADGTYLLTGYDEDGITWQPDAAGTYYVRISPWSASSAQYCDAYYDLLILPVRAELFLPLIRR